MYRNAHTEITKYTTIGKTHQIAASELSSTPHSQISSSIVKHSQLNLSITNQTRQEKDTQQSRYTLHSPANERKEGKETHQETQARG